MKHPCQSDFDTQGDDYPNLEIPKAFGTIWQKHKIIIV